MPNRPTNLSLRAGGACVRMCLLGCVGLILLLIAVMFLFYSSSGHYRPVAPPPLPLPVPNALDAYRNQLLNAASQASTWRFVTWNRS
jgi:hypothetical protein